MSVRSWYAHPVVWTMRAAGGGMLTLIASCMFGSSGASQTGGNANGTSTTGSASPTDGDETTGSGGVSSADGGPTGDTTTRDSGSTDGCTSSAELGCACQADEDCIRGLVCPDDVCAAPECGNGRVELDEECDDANPEPDDGCEPDCQRSRGVAQVALALEHTCARTHEGNVKCWGRGGDGRLGYGNPDDIGVIDTPSDHPFVQIGGAAVDICAGPLYTCVALADGNVRCWGDGGQGKLGTGSNTGNIGDDEHPHDIDPIEIGGFALAVTCGSGHACALLQGGDVRCWGNPQFGRLGSLATAVVGDDEHPNIFRPVNVGGVVTQVVAADLHTCALLESGDVRCWGRATTGRLGNGTTTPDIGDNEPPNTPGNIIDLGLDILQISSGLAHTCALLDGGAVKCWGEGGDGQLGYGDVADIGDNETVAEVMVFADIGGPVVGIFAGSTHTCAVLQTAEVRCWGDGGDGKLGYGDVLDHLVAPAVAVNLGIGVFPLEMELAPRHTCARVTGGELVCFGFNSRGQLGLGPPVSGEPVGDNEDPADVGFVPF